MGFFTRRDEGLPLADQFEQQVLVMDGSMRDALAAQGLPPSESPELVNVDRPEIIADIHRAYVDAGAGIIRTNTFAASAPALARFGAESRMREINAAAVKAARIAGARHIYGAIGPTGLSIAPYGPIPFDEAYRVFRDQIEALADAGIEGIIVENMVDLQEARVAILAALETAAKPVACTFAFGDGGRMPVSETDPLGAAVTIAGMGVSHLGPGQGVDPVHVAQLLELMGRASAVPLICLVDAGREDVLLSQLDACVEAGAGIVGTSGGAVALTRTIAERVTGKVPPRRRRSRATLLCSRKRLVPIHPDAGTVMIGERINAANSPRLAEFLRGGDLTVAVEEAKQQVAAGAHVLDINVSIDEVDEAKMLAETIGAVQAEVEVPLSINTASPRSLDRALRVYCGKALVNFVSAKDGSLARMLPVVKKYGAAVIGLTLDEQGIPATVFDKVDLAKLMLDACEDAGIAPNDLVMDCIVIGAAENQEQVREALDAVRQVSKKMELNTTLRIASVSHGMPNRFVLNRAFLAMGLAAGLDSAIVDPLEPGMAETFAASDVLLGRDKGAAAFKQRFG
ncbi:MAG: hypothetical protein C4521_07390 [Actinobacteria bacterium]|nr:MAG: hypothetical protein C4521_07390 [Actinomycetota bacterium]